MHDQHEKQIDGIVPGASCVKMWIISACINAEQGMICAEMLEARGVFVCVCVVTTQTQTQTDTKGAGHPMCCHR
jgi:hypothetical protein